MTAPAGDHRRALPLIARAAVYIAVCLAVALAGVGWLTGWRTHAMTTPSMGTTLPVGTLVVSHPATLATMQVGDIVVFHPPGHPSETYAHRVHAVVAGPDGAELRTEGDINGMPDPWVLDQADLVGRAVLAVPDAGFVLEALPWLLCGSFLIVLLTSGMVAERRSATRVALWSLLGAGLLWHFRPLERVVLLKQTLSAGHGVAVVVPTGALPLRVSATGGTSVNLAPGQVGTVQLTHVRPNGAFAIHSTVHLTGWWWLALLLWVAPMLVGLRLRRRPQEGSPGAAGGTEVVDLAGAAAAATPMPSVATTEVDLGSGRSAPEVLDVAAPGGREPTGDAPGSGDPSTGR